MKTFLQQSDSLHHLVYKLPSETEETYKVIKAITCLSPPSRISNKNCDIKRLQKLLSSVKKGSKLHLEYERFK